MKRQALTDNKSVPTRERIISAAREVFYEKGVHASSVEEIAQGGGLSRATVYLHFSSKDEILLELLKEDLNYQLEVYRKLASLERVSLAAVRKWLIGFCKYVEERQNSLNLFWSAGAIETNREDIANPHRDEVIVLLGRRFDGFDIDALGRASREVRRAKCHMMLYLIEGIAMNTSRAASGVDKKGATEILAPILLEFLRGGDLGVVAN